MEQREQQLAKNVNKRQKTYSTRSHILKQNTQEDDDEEKNIERVVHPLTVQSAGQRDVEPK